MLDPVLVVAAACFRDGRLLCARRPPHARHAGRWELPGGKVKPGEHPEDALRREVREELGVGADVGRIRDVVYHRYPERAVLLLVYRCALDGEPGACEPGMAIAWADAPRVRALDWLEADRSLAEDLARELERGAKA